MKSHQSKHLTHIRNNKTFKCFFKSSKGFFPQFLSWLSGQGILPLSFAQWNFFTIDNLKHTISIIPILVVYLNPTSLFSFQKNILRGSVFEINSRTPISGVSVIPKGANSTVTNDLGRFKCEFDKNIPGDEITLEFKKKGYKLINGTDFKVNLSSSFMTEVTILMKKDRSIKVPPPPPPPPPPPRYKLYGQVTYEDGSIISPCALSLFTSDGKYNIEISPDGTYSTQELQAGENVTLSFTINRLKQDTTFILPSLKPGLITTTFPLPKFFISGNVAGKIPGETNSEKNLEGVRISTNYDQYRRIWHSNSAGNFGFEIKARPRSLIKIKFDHSPEYEIRESILVLDINNPNVSDLSVELIKM